MYIRLTRECDNCRASISLLPIYCTKTNKLDSIGKFIIVDMAMKRQYTCFGVQSRLDSVSSLFGVSTLYPNQCV